MNNSFKNRPPFEWLLWQIKGNKYDMHNNNVEKADSSRCYYAGFSNGFRCKPWWLFGDVCPIKVGQLLPDVALTGVDGKSVRFAWVVERPGRY